MVGASQTTRTRGRHAQSKSTASTHLTSELGVLSEDALQDKLLEQEREIEQLRAQISSLERQLLTRPPLKDVQNLELLLQGTQRENERCMADIQRGKERERLLEKELSNLLGEHWQRKLEFQYPAGDSSGKQAHQDSEPSEAIPQGVKLMILGMDQKLEEGEARIRMLMEEAQKKANTLSDHLQPVGSY